MDTEELRKLKKKTAEQTLSRRKYFKLSYGVLGHQFGVWARLLDEDELSVWYLYCSICCRPMIYNAVTDTIDDFPARCPGPPTLNHDDFGNCS